MVRDAVLTWEDHFALGGVHERFVHAHLINFDPSQRSRSSAIGFFVLPIARF
jgi:hypothetical protein